MRRPDLAWQCLGQVAQGFVVPFWKEERLDRLEIVLMKVIKCCCSRWTCYWPGLLDKRLHLFSNLSVVLVDEPEQELALMMVMITMTTVIIMATVMAIIIMMVMTIIIMMVMTTIMMMVRIMKMIKLRQPVLQNGRTLCSLYDYFSQEDSWIK